MHTSIAGADFKSIRPPYLQKNKNRNANVLHGGLFLWHSQPFAVNLPKIYMDVLSAV